MYTCARFRLSTRILYYQCVTVLVFFFWRGNCVGAVHLLLGWTNLVTPDCGLLLGEKHMGRTYLGYLAGMFGPQCMSFSRGDKGYVWFEAPCSPAKILDLPIMGTTKILATYSYLDCSRYDYQNFGKIIRYLFGF